MSFFFDLWTPVGFVLASDVRLVVNDEQRFCHKIFSPYRCKVTCAIAVCGDFPKFCIQSFCEASNKKDTLREIAEYFADKWTGYYAGTNLKSAVHLVGFERVEGSSKVVPQVWYWYSWSPSTGFLSQERLQEDLASFSRQVPNNNHIPSKIEGFCDKFPSPTLEDEREAVLSYLRGNPPLFTWNGDSAFWHSALGVVTTATGFFLDKKSNWTLEELAELTGFCLEFLAKISGLLPSSTVALSPSDEVDILMVTPSGTKLISEAKLPDDSQIL